MNPTFLDFPLYALPKTELSPPAGDGKKGVLVLFESDPADAEALSGFLDKVLQAVKIDRLADAKTLVITPKQSISLTRLECFAQSRCLLIFGASPAQLGLHLQMADYQPTDFGGRMLLRADSLSAIMQERQDGGKAMSGKLWKALQSLFL